MTSQTMETHTLVSYNRPLTRGAKAALEEYSIVEEEAVNEHGKWTVVETESKPPKELLDKHELRLEREPKAEYKANNGDTVRIYEDQVIVEGVEATIEPEQAIEHAENNGWGELD